MKIPTLAYEQQLWNAGVEYVAGVDEVGRGALAGPVVAAAVLINKTHRCVPGVRDSKTLSKSQKQTLNQLLLVSDIKYAVGEASPEEIDALGIVPATALAMQRALETINHNGPVLIDGLPFKNKLLLHPYQKTFIVKGDSISYSIAAASIVAKVYRDSLMINTAQLYPHYGFEKNVGYGSAFHLQAVQKYGVSNCHRNSFLTKIK